MPKRRNSAIKKYQTQTKKTRFKFQVYVGMNANTGKQRMTTRRGFMSYEEANEAYHRIQSEVMHGTYQTKVEKETNTFNDVYKLWWKNYVNEVKPSTANKTEEWITNHILPIFGDIKIDKITAADCQKAVDRWSTELVRYKTLANYSHRIFHYAVVLGLRTANPFNQIIIPKKGKLSHRDAKNNYWDHGQLKLFLNILKNRPLMQQTAFRTLAFTGMRRGELLALQWRDIDFNEHTITINKTLARDRDGKIITQTPKTAAGNRVIPVDNKTLSLLRNWHTEQRKFLHLGHRYQISQLVLTTQANQPLPFTQIGHWLDQIIRDYNAGEKPQDKLKRITTHGFRHTFATLMYESNPDITPKDLQKLLGHDTVQVTMDIYTHATKEGQQKIFRVLDQLDL